jgi:hypothetical protein
MKSLLAANLHPDITDVQTFAEAGLTYKPVGLKVRFADGSAVFVQFVGTSPTGGDRPDHPDYKIPKERL